MRELKFRAWHKIFKRMLEPDEWHHYSGACVIKGELTSSENVILLQYTGLKDKNGKEIYEGYILSSGEAQGVMEWVEHNNTASWALFAPLNKFEVIGNIYENPELLEATNNE